MSIKSLILMYRTLLMICLSGILVSCEGSSLFNPETKFYRKFYVSFERPEPEPGVEFKNAESLSIDEIPMWTTISVLQGNKHRSYQYQGESVDGEAIFKYFDFTYGLDHSVDHVYAYYPMSFGLPYLKDVFMEGGSICYSLTGGRLGTIPPYRPVDDIKVAVSEDNHLHFKNVFGFLCARLYGEEIPVSSIYFGTNTDEMATERAIISMKLGGTPSYQPSPDFDCELYGVFRPLGGGANIPGDQPPITIGKSAENYTDFILVAEPGIYSKGITAVIVKDTGQEWWTEAYDSHCFLATSYDPIVIHRNKIALVEMEVKPMPRLFYTTTDENPVIQEWGGGCDWGGNSLEYNLSTESFAVRVIRNGYEDGRGFYTFSGIPSRIADGAFNMCKNLSSIDIPDFITDDIGKWAFGGCDNLKEITLPPVSRIDTGAFYGCSNLASVSLSEGLLSLGVDAFSYCSKLSSIILPSTIKKIGNNAFYGCSNMSSITILAENPPVIESPFYGTDWPICVPASSVDKYKAEWPDYADRIKAI